MDNEQYRPNRRQFLKIFLRTTASITTIGTGVDGILAHISGQDTPLTPLWEQIETNSLLHPISPDQINRQFRVNIFQPDSPIGVSDPTISVRLGEKTSKALVAKNPQGVVCPWDQPRLSLLNEVLSELPPSFYSSTPQPMNFILWQGTDMSRRQLGEPDAFRGTCLCDQQSDTNNLPPTVIFVKKDLRTLTIDQPPASKLIVHELSHHRTLKRANFLGGVNIIIDSLFNTLGIPLTDVYNLPDPSLIKLFKKHITITPGIEGRGEHVYLNESDLMGSSITPRELVANLSETYFFGHSEFSQTFEPDLGTDLCKIVYKFTQENIFDNYEYVDGKRIT